MESSAQNLLKFAGTWVGDDLEHCLEELHLDTRLIPPSMPYRRIKVKFRFIGKERPRIVFNPAR